MKQYSTHCTSINVADGQTPAWPSNTLDAWTREGWRVFTAAIHPRGPGSHPYEAMLYCLLERDVPPEPQNDGT